MHAAHLCTSVVVILGISTSRKRGSGAGAAWGRGSAVARAADPLLHLPVQEHTHSRLPAAAAGAHPQRERVRVGCPAAQFRPEWRFACLDHVDDRLKHNDENCLLES